ncbi:AAA family ATPase [Novosphingobium sp. KCTC 2891]|uniref:AAA family ATPase n=1 Tax=Novosphingobium sp. KCTC 2891 TaxID=2989730 RepID=UPI0022220EA3|nr:AAA family ATPase [Novosphingobium sp. KCTC 2891]MCW1384903.1 AAA family ATPase [Novosphingobium sp. KCTC 2891]
MRLQFNRTHLSVTSFPTIELPGFAVITGPNGAGKSHLLQAITNGSIQTDVAQANTPTQEIRMFDWNTLVPQDTGAFSSEHLRNEREQARNNFLGLRQHPEAMEPLRAIGRQWNLPSDYIDNPTKLLGLPSEVLATMVPAGMDVVVVEEQIAAAANASSNWILQHTDDNTKATLIAMSTAAKRPIIAMNDKHLDTSGIPNWGRSDLFQQSFARLFVAYRDAKVANLLAELQASKGQTGVEFLSEEEFSKENGPPPWDFVNQTVKSAGLDFEINSPSLYDFSPYTPQLTKNSSGSVVNFSSLSSGEKILMSFAFCVYYANDRRQLAVYPKLILLDEIDAPLHPAMTKSLVDTITGTLVGEFGINVLATTHSPSTVAMSPEDSLFMMRPGRPGLTQVKKAEALNILTVGVPTLAISFDGRRQVFVESPADAKTYDALYKLLKPRIVSERSLEFVSTGGQTNVGCDVVKRLVESLVGAGNQSVFGLIDHDGHHQGSARIAVLGDGKRNGLENFIFDPLLIAALICRDVKEHRSAIGMVDSLTYPSFLLQGPSDMQEIVDRVTEAVFGDLSEQRIETEYFGSYSLSLDQRWLLEDDHSLEAKVIDAFPSIQALTKRQAGKLMQHIVGKVLSDRIELLPRAIADTIVNLLERDSHI